MRAVVLVYVYNFTARTTSRILGFTSRSAKRWLKLFCSKGVVIEDSKPKLRSRYSQEVKDFICEYFERFPCFYLEEQQAELEDKFPHVKNVSISTLCRCLNFDLKLTRKIISRRAQEASEIEIASYLERLTPIYHFPQQLVFVDESIKDMRDILRRRR